MNWRARPASSAGSDSAGARRTRNRRSTEAAFRYAVNDDAMAIEKLAEGIRVFAADSQRLEQMIPALG